MGLTITKKEFHNPPDSLIMVLDMIELGIMIIDKEYNIIFINKEKRERNPEVKPGMFCYNVFEEYGMRCPFCIAHKAMESGKIQRNRDYIAIQKGEELPVHLNLSVFPVYDENDNLLGAIEIAYNTEHIYQTNMQFERLNSEYEHVIYALSHDLRAPLVSIEGFLRKLKRGHIDLADDIALHCLNRIHANVEMMNGLVKILLDTSRIATGRLEIQDVDINYLVENVINQFRQIAIKQKATIKTKGKFKIIQCDGVRTRQIFTNLIDNALEHGQNIKNLEIEIGYKNKTFWIKDNGPGISSDFLNKAFEAFTRAGDENKQHLGMGMNIVYKIVQKHGGKTWIESTVGEGTTVFFTLS